MSEYAPKKRPRLLRPEPTWRTLMMLRGSMPATDRSVLHAIAMATPPMVAREFESASAFRRTISVMAGCKPEQVDRTLTAAANAGWIAKIQGKFGDEIALTVPDGVPLSLSPGHAGEIITLEMYEDELA